MMTLSENLGNGPHHSWIRNHIDYPYADCCLIWPFRTERAGYAAFNMDGKMLSVHRYICELVHGPAPEGYVAAHSCGRGHEGCVNHHHLSWKTNSENQLERNDRGKRSKLTRSIAAEIRALAGTELPEITAMRFDVSESAVRQVQSGKTWRDDLRTRPADLEPAVAAAILDLKGRFSIAAIAREFGVSYSVAWRILNGKTYKHAQTIGMGEP